VTRTDHTQVQGACSSCHNGTVATGTTQNHVPAGNNCEACHSTLAWRPALFDHAGVQAGTCASCHNSVNATGKPTNHIVTSESCDTCHGTLVWKPARFDHARITSGCQGCHNGTSATGKPTGHMQTARECSTCHKYPAWTPLTFRHTSSEYPGDHTGTNPTCRDCHTTNTDQATWRNAAYRPKCAGCHASDYESGPHTKYGNTRYTVAELANCSGACHVYTDSTLRTISKTRNGPQHRVTQRGFD
jgi:hypothetical protein